MLASCAYQPLGILLALVAITAAGCSSRRVMRLSLWMVAALLLALFQPCDRWLTGRMLVPM
jgi:hypothetical protein